MSAYRHCVTEGSADRQRQFEEALLTIMGTKPLDQISIQEICDRVGLSRKSFYRYFSSKESCLHALVDHAILDFTDVLFQGERMQQLLERFFAYWREKAPLLDALCRNQCGDLLFERSVLCAIQEYGIRSYLGEDSSYERTIFFISGLFGLLLSWHNGGFQKSPAQLAETLNGFLPQYPNGVF